jgi:hypothetical protein
VDHFGSFALQPIGSAAVGPIAITIGISTTLYFAAILTVLVTLSVIAVRAVQDFQLSSPTTPTGIDDLARMTPFDENLRKTRTLPHAILPLATTRVV